MATSRWAFLMNRLHRSSELLRDNTSRILRMDGVNAPPRSPMTLLSCTMPDAVRQLALGVDADIGGTSEAHLEFVPDAPAAGSSAGASSASGGNGSAGVSSSARAPTGTARFWGEMRLGVRSDLQGKIRGGYAGFRSQPRPTLFGELTHDISQHEFLAVRARVGGSPRTRGAYFVNVQSDSPVSGELWQHRLYFARSDGKWEDIFIPFSAFALTSYGELSTGPGHVSLVGEHIRWLGVSILGGNSGMERPFELGLHSIRAVNHEDVTTPVRTGRDANAGNGTRNEPVNDGL